MGSGTIRIKTRTLSVFVGMKCYNWFFVCSFDISLGRVSDALRHFFAHIAFCTCTVTFAAEMSSVRISYLEALEAGG